MLRSSHCAVARVAFGLLILASLSACSTTVPPSQVQGEALPPKDPTPVNAPTPKAEPNSSDLPVSEPPLLELPQFPVSKALELLANGSPATSVRVKFDARLFPHRDQNCSAGLVDRVGGK